MSVFGAVVLLRVGDCRKVSMTSIERPYAGRVAPELPRLLGYKSLHVG